MIQDRPFVMLVDDDEEDAFVLRKAFAGGRVPIVFEHLLCGGDLMAFLRPGRFADSAQTGQRTPDVILLDINMPAMDGFQVLRGLRRNDATRAIPVVMFTTSHLDDDIERAYREGANSYVVKPSSIDGMRRFVECFDQFWLQLAALPSTKP